MILLSGDADLISVVTSAAADIEPHASWVVYDTSGGAITPGRTNTASIVTATTTTIVPALGSATERRRLTLLSLRNNHASTACDVTVRHDDGTNIETLEKVTLLAGEALEMDSRGEWHHYATDGGEYPAVPTIASRAEMEAATNLVTGVTPGRQHYHPAHPKFWCHAATSTGTPFVLDSYNLTSLTDTATGRLTFNVNVDFGNANYCIQASVQRSSTSLTVTNLKYQNVRNGTQAVGSFEVEVYDGTATTHVQEDPNDIYAAAQGDAV